jgi:hypothetical protein
VEATASVVLKSEAAFTCCDGAERHSDGCPSRAPLRHVVGQVDGEKVGGFLVTASGDFPLGPFEDDAAVVLQEFFGVSRIHLVADRLIEHLEDIPIEKVRKSQAATVSQRIANTEIAITYSRPVARGRELFGALVPYDEIWNPGADQATAFAFTRDVHIDDHPVRAGKYSLWAIPRSDRWTLIFSTAADVYHTPYPGEAHDALRVEVRPERGPHMEALMLHFPSWKERTPCCGSIGVTTLRGRRHAGHTEQTFT